MKVAKDYIGPSDIKIEDGKMTPEVLLSLGRLSDPQLSPDGTTILYGVSYTDISQNRSVRNLFTTPAAGGEKTRLTAEGKSISCARWAPDGKAIYFLQGGQLYKAPYRDGKLGRKQLLSDVEDGMGEFALSPDGKSIIYSAEVRSSVELPSDSDPALDKAQAYATEDLMYRHWDHWVEKINHTFIAGLDTRITRDNSIDILGGEDVKFQLPNGPWGGLEQLSFSPDGRRIAYSCKKLTGREYAFSTNSCIYVYDIDSGETSQLTFSGGYDTDPVWSPDGSCIAFLSMERDGYEADKTRLMVIPSSGGDARDLTASFKYNAAGPLWSDDRKSIIFNALAEGLQGIFKVSVENASIERLTPDNLWYDFFTPFAVLGDGTLLTSYCSMEFPLELVAVRGGVPERITGENDAILSQLTAHKTELRYVKTVDGEDMLTWVLFPPEFDPAKKYPAIEITLGGPQGTLSQDWSYRWNYLLMTHQGYVVVLPNRRGTTAFGQPWCEEISGDYIGLNMQDYLSAAREIKAEPYISGVAACGASYGGYSVYYLAGIHGDVYDCFISHAGIFNEEHMYMTTEEMWFPNWDNGGLHEYQFTPGELGPRGDGQTFGGIRQGGSPWSNLPKAVRHYSNSPHTLVQNWHTPILCIHGCMDFRVPYDEAMAAFGAAQMMGVPSKLILFPEENHWIIQPQNALYWHRSYFGWLDRWMK